MSKKDNITPKCSDGHRGYKGPRVIMDNLPALIMYALGAIILSYLGIVLSVVYVLYCILSTFWFMRFICTYCPHYDKFTCPCGFSKISAKLFKKRDAKEFKTMFKRHIGIVFPSFFVPVIAAVFILLGKITIEVISLLTAFIVVGFVILPIVSRKYGCKDCELKENCPWMRGCGK